MSNNQALTIVNQTITLYLDQQRQQAVSAVADQYARANTFSDYSSEKADNTTRRQRGDLALFAQYLTAVTFYPAVDDMLAAQRAEYVRHADELHTAPSAWASITYGLVAGFVRWQLDEGYAIRSVNVRLSTVKRFAQLAFTAGAIGAEQLALIRTVTTKTFSQQVNIDKGRTVTRRGDKKADPVLLTASQVAALRKQPSTPQGVRDALLVTQVKALKTQPATAQGRRDALLMTLLLDLGLRVGELALIDVANIDLQANTLTFFRPKVGKIQTLDLKTADLRRTVQAWFESGDASAAGKLLRASAKGGKLGAPGMSERAITKRVAGLSAHNLRHSWATRASRAKTDAFALQESGGWNSLAMPRRYVEAAKIANEGVELGEDE